jgi:nucleoid DNA-binding protein/exonuclease VII small subunit
VQRAEQEPALTRAQLIADIAADNPHLRVADVELIVAAIFDQITAVLARGGRVELRDFGAFTDGAQSAYRRGSIHPRQGAAVLQGRQGSVEGRPAQQQRRGERTLVPLDWAQTQHNLGNVLLALGGRESGTVRLEEAITAYRAALQERMRERAPLDWAWTQNNLGTALLTLGKRESGTARLEEAVAAYQAALQEWTRDWAPLGWASAHAGLGNALLALGGRESGTARLEEAVAAYRAALQEWTRERVPLDWASAQSGLSYALEALGERQKK